MLKFTKCHLGSPNGVRTRVSTLRRQPIKRLSMFEQARGVAARVENSSNRPDNLSN